MKPRPLLFNAEPEALGGGAAPASNIIALSAAPVAEAPAAAEPAVPVAAVEPSLLEKVKASIQSKGTLLATADAATLRAETAEAEVLTLRSQLSTLHSQLSTLQTERAGIEAALVTAKAENQAVDTAAASQVAALGFEAAALPAANSAPEPTKAELEAKLAEATDNNTRFDLAAQLNALA